MQIFCILYICPIIICAIIIILTSFMMRFLNYNKSYSFDDSGHLIFIPFVNWAMVLIFGVFFMIIFIDFFGGIFNKLIAKIF